MSSPRKFLLQIKLVMLVYGNTLQSSWNPAGPISLRDTSSSLRFGAIRRLCASIITPWSPMMFPLMFKLSNEVFLTIPCDMDLIPCTMSSLNSTLRTLRDFECFSNFYSGLPTSDFRKFLAKFSYSRLIELLMIGIAPSLFKSFSETFRHLSVSFWLRAIPIHSPPSEPKSLSEIHRLCKFLLRISSAAMHTAP